MLADEFPEHDIVGPNRLGGSPVSFTVTVPDCDVVFDRAVSAGGEVIRPVADQFHGHRQGMVRDPWGHRWTVSTPIHDRYEAEAATAGWTYTRADTTTDTTADTTADEHVDPHQLKHFDRGDLFYFTLPTADLARSQAFFGAVLGWQFLHPENGHVESIAAPSGGLHLDGPQQVQLWFVVDDIHAAVAAVRAHGGHADEPVLHDSGWDASCTDDQGTPFHLSVPAEKYVLP